MGNLHFFTQLMPYIIPTRTEAVIFYEQDFDVTKTLEYVKKCKADPQSPKISLFYILLYAGIRAICQRPKMNRFVSGCRYYQRNRISYNFVAKRELSDEGEEINVTMSFSPLLSLEGFCKKIENYVNSLKKGSSSESEKLNNFLTKLPRFIIKFLFSFVKWLDYNNALPRSIIDSLPFYSSIFFANVGSVGIDAPFHHNFELGNCGIFCAVGKIRRENFITSDGSVESRDRVKIAFTFDDRITDGIYCAKAVDLFRDLVENPEKLEIPLELTAEQLADLGLAEKELALEGEK